MFFVVTDKLKFLQYTFLGFLILSGIGYSLEIKCLLNEEYKSGTVPEGTCDVQSLVVTSRSKTITGCFCVNKHVRNTKGACVPKSQCDEEKCLGLNEEFSKCGTACPDRCSYSVDEITSCSLQCVVGCFCRPGYLRNDKNQCVLPIECNVQKKCPGSNEEFTSCGTGCPDECGNYADKSKICNAQCVVGCFCHEGYVRNDKNHCVLPTECPKPDVEDNIKKCLGSNEEFNRCGTACPSTCSNYLDENRACTLQCVVGCFCHEGFVRNDEKKCVLPSDCHKKRISKCPQPNDEYLTCGPACQCTCRNYKMKLFCSKKCVEGCFCSKGYLKNEHNLCVLAENCSIFYAGVCQSKYEIKPSIGAACEASCKNHLSCVPPPEDQCICSYQTVRDFRGRCVTIDKCPNKLTNHWT